MTTSQQAIDRSYKFRSLETAKSFRAKCPVHLRIVLGCDGRYWVAATPRDQSVLTAAGYETV